jgi:Ca2+-binding RTX toxin-like protein
MTTRQLFIIDPRVTDCESLVSALPEGSEWVLLDAERDGVLQLREIMEAYQGLDSIQIFSHGAQGSLLLGNTILNSGNIESYAQMLAQIGASLGPEGDLLLYGCNVGQGDIGHAFIAQLAQLTGADVAASENVTGSASLGGDWVLEQTSGSVQASTMSAPTYAGTLDVIDGTPGDDVRVGTEFSDALNGFEGNDSLDGAGGTDTLIGGLGDDLLVGGVGHDIAMYAGVQVSYAITQNSNGVQVTAPEGTDTLQGIETVQFADATILVSFWGVGPAELRVNSTTADTQGLPAITALADGGWVATWVSNYQDGSGYGYGIFAQRYASNGMASGAEFRVNTYTDGDQDSPVITALADGGWVVTWRSYGQDGSSYGIYAQRYDAAGAASGAEFRVNTYATYDQSAPSVTALADGGWVVTWHSQIQDGWGYGIYAQRYASNGTASGTEFQVNSTTLNSQEQPAITALADGGWLVTWESYGLDGSDSHWSICAQRYASNGVASGPEIQVNSTTGYNHQYPATTALADGGWVVTWQSSGHDGSGYGIYAQRYASNGTASGTEFQVNSTTLNSQEKPAVAALADGGWLVTWQSSGQDGSGYGIYAQRYASNGTASGTEFQVNSTTLNSQEQPEITALADGGWLVTWESYGQDGSSYGIYAQRYNAAGEQVGAMTLDITGDATSQRLTGASSGDTINGLAGDDTLDGGTGADTLIGGTGNDLFLVDNSGDVVTELNGEGADEVRSSVSYVLLAHVENLTLTGAGAFNGKGNTLDNVITGNGADNTLDGGAGADTLIGGSGNDVYLVDNAGDVVTELPGEGTDEVRSSVSYTLGANLENLTLSGSAAIDGTGNTLNNMLTGNSADNTLDGGTGADTLNGGAGADTLIGGAGDDRLIGGDGLDVASYSGIYASYTVSQGPTGAPQVSGSEGSDTLQGIETLGFSDATVQVSFGGVGPAEFRVNTYTTNDQTAPAVTALADGGWVVTWQSQSQDGSDYGIYAQRYNAAGTASGVEFQVNTYTTWFQIAPSVTALADGGWVVTWQSFFQDVTDGINFGIYAQRYNAAGTATGAEFRVNTYTTNDQNAPSVTALADGGWVVTWQSYGQDGSVYGIYGQRYNAAGTASGAEFWVNTYTNDHQSAPSVTALADGGWVVTWQSYQDGWGHGIYAQRYNAAGTATGAEFRVNTYTTNDQSAPSVTALADGGWVVTWHSEGQDEWGYGIYAQRYNAAGTASGVEFQVNTYTTNDQYAPSVTALSDGGWVVTWQSSNQDGWSTGIYAQRYTAAGTASGVEFQVNTYTTSNQDGPSVTALADGGWVVTWQSLIQDGSGYGIYAQRYDAAGAGVGGLTLDITGDASSQYLTGAGYGDTISGLAGDDTLDGGTGADTLIGGTGNDQYLVDNSADVVTELNGDGTDEVRSSVSYVLLAHVENLTLTGAGAFNGKGNTLDNVITGNGADNTLDGGAGADTLIGGAGNDVYVVDNSGDVVTELPGEGTDEVRSSVSYTLGANLENLTLTGSAAIDGTGNALNNVLTGNSGDNLLDGGAGVDTMIGGTGNDIYIVDNAGDVVTELTGEGTDAIRSSVTNTLSLNVEKLTLTGAAAINGTGNVLDNVVSGNGADNTLDGGAGADTLSGGAGNDLFMVDNTGDVVIEQTGEGTDEIRSSVSYTLSANVEKLTLIGSAGAIDGIGNELDNVLMGTNANNRLEGRAGADTLIGGGGGADTMVGGTGDDTYWVYYTGDVVVELNGGGTDLVQSAVSYSLSRTVENLTLLGTNDLIGNGNYLANRIQGNAGANTLSGWDGDDTLMGFNGTDTLNGGFGNDVLIVQNGGNQLQGGWGADTFAFQQASNYENEIKDFTAGDFIQLEDLASIASVGAGDGATVGLGQVQYQVESGRTTLWIGMDSLAGADAVLYLDGFTNVGDLRALGNRLSVHPNASPTGSVTITGTATQGQTLTASNTLVDTDGIPSSGPGAISYQWLRNGSVVDGATAGSYVLTQADVGKPMSVRVSYTDGMGTAEAVTSDATASVANVNDLPSGTVSITGTAIQGQTLSTDTTTLADLDGLGTLGYQWLRGGNAIASATSASYSLVQADVGAAISVRVSYTDALGTAETVTSAASGAVANINDAPSGGVTISGTPNQGQVLSAVVSTLADADGIGTLSYQWKAGGIDISGAIAGSYTLTAGEVGKTISVTVSYTDLMGTAESVTSAATANVAVPANLTLTGTAGAETLNGDMGNDSLSGLGGNDTLNGFAGNDTLNGGTGTDSLVGGEGGDLYLMASAAEHSAAEVSDSGATGSDEVRFTATSAGTLSLFAGDTGIERVVIGTGTGATAITSATTALNVNAAAVLNALSITGNAGANTLTGTALADTLDGGAGVDSLVGGGGNDTYIVDNTADVVTESSSTGGTDLVQASVSYTLGTNVENLTLIGAAAINATGNTAANLLTGNAAANILTGAAGADTMDGADGADLYLIAAATDHSAAEVINDSGASGIDEIRFTATTASTLILSAGISGIESVVIGTGTAAAAVTTGTTALNVNAAAVAQSLAITGNDGANTLTGSAFADTLSGGLGNDTLIGGAGADSLVGGGGTDSMSGGAGDDTYGVDATTDIVNESVAGSSGIDTVQSSVTYSLNTVAAASVEHLTLTGTSAINATGNALANILTGNSGANNLSGGDGDDTLIGGAGNDTLTGGNGLDTASYAGTAGAVTVSLALATAQVTGGAGTDTLATIEHLIGGNGNDSLSGSTGDNRIDAGLGNDTVNGGAGNDTLIGGRRDRHRGLQQHRSGHHRHLRPRQRHLHRQRSRRRRHRQRHGILPLCRHHPHGCGIGHDPTHGWR